MNPAQQLNSWKEIAAYLARSVRTVHRWERHEQLPIHRLNHSKASSVYALRSELDAWLLQRSLTTPPDHSVTPCDTAQSAYAQDLDRSSATPAPRIAAQLPPNALVQPPPLLHRTRSWAWAACAISLALLMLLLLFRASHLHLELRLTPASSSLPQPQLHPLKIQS